MAYQRPLRSSQQYTAALRAARALAEEITAVLRRVPGTEPGFTVFPYTATYVYYEQYLTVVAEGLLTMAMCLAPTFFVSFLLLGMDLRSSIATLITIAMILLDTVGLMALWDIPYNAVALINLVAAVGISVEFVSHLTVAFVQSRRPTRVERAAEATINMGSKVVAGVAMTNLPGIVVLAFAKAQLIQIFFFRLNFIITLVGLAHGLVFLPVLLSYMGPAPLSMESSKVGKEGTKFGMEGSEFGTEDTQFGTPGSQFGMLGSQAGTKSTRFGTLGTQAGTKSTQFGTLGTQAGTEGTQAGTEGTQFGREGTQAGMEGTQAGTEGIQAGTESTQFGRGGTQAGTEGTQAGTKSTQFGMLGTQAGTEGTQAGTESTQFGTLGTQAGTKGPQFGRGGTQAGTEGTQAGTEGTQAATESTQFGTEGTQAATEGTQAGSEGTQAGTEGAQFGTLGTQAGTAWAAGIANPGFEAAAQG